MIRTGVGVSHVLGAAKGFSYSVGIRARRNRALIVGAAQGLPAPNHRQAVVLVFCERLVERRPQAHAGRGGAPAPRVRRVSAVNRPRAGVYGGFIKCVPTQLTEEPVRLPVPTILLADIVKFTGTQRTFKRR